MNKKAIAIAAGVIGLFVTFVTFGIILLTRGTNSNEEATTTSGNVLLKTDNSINYSFINWHLESAVGGVLAAILTLAAIYTVLKRIKTWWRGRFPVTTPTPPRWPSCHHLPFTPQP